MKKITFCIDDELHDSFDSWLHIYKQATGYKATKTQVLIMLLEALIDLTPDDVKADMHQGDNNGK